MRAVEVQYLYLHMRAMLKENIPGPRIELGTLPIQKDNRGKILIPRNSFGKIAVPRKRRGRKAT